MAASTDPTSLTTAGFAHDTAEKLDLGYRSGLLQGIHSVLIRRGGEVALERYFSGEDQTWGQALGHVEFSANGVHDLRSVTKSITSLLYGIALADGKVAAPDTPLLVAFPEYADLAKDPARAAWTIEHALNMTLGTEWNEDLPYSDPANSEIQMERAADRYRFIFDRPIVAPAGSRWVYNGGCSALLGHLIATGTGKSLEDFAREKLFQPLGIGHFEWAKGQDGVPSSASGLRLTARDLARIGQLVLDNGSAIGRQVVPAAWVAACMTPSAETSFGLLYSRQWYLSEQFVSSREGDAADAFSNGQWRAAFVRVAVARSRHHGVRWKLQSDGPMDPADTDFAANRACQHHAGMNWVSRTLSDLSMQTVFSRKRPRA